MIEKNKQNKTNLKSPPAGDLGGFTITSPQNPLIKEILLLQSKSKERKKADTIVIEGKKEISLAASAGLIFRKNTVLPRYYFD